MNFNFEKITKKNTQEEHKFFDKELEINGIKYDVFLGQQEHGRYSLSFTAENSSYLTNKGFAHNNELFKQISEFVIQTCKKENISEFFYWADSEKLTMEQVGEIKDSLQVALKNKPDLFKEEKKIITPEMGKLPSSVIVKDNSIYIFYGKKKESLKTKILSKYHEKDFNIKELIMGDNIEKFGRIILNQKYAAEFFETYNLPELEKYKSLFSESEDSEKKSRQRAMLYERVIRQIFPDSEIKEEDGGYLVKIDNEYLYK